MTNEFDNPWLAAQIRMMQLSQGGAYQDQGGGSSMANLAGHAPAPNSHMSNAIHDWMKQQDSIKLGGKVSGDQTSALNSGAGPLTNANADDRTSSINLGIMQPSSYNQNASSNALQGMSSSSALNMGGLSPSTYSRYNLGMGHSSWG